MSKYRAFLTPDELSQFDEIVRQQAFHRLALQQLREDYVKLFGKARDRAKTRKSTDAKMIERTRAWAGRFRSAAAEMSTEPPTDIHPVLWEAQRESFLAQAADLDAQAEAQT